MVNTLLDLGLFVLLHGELGVGLLLANFVSTSAGMTFSFVVNGLVTFRAQRLTLRQALLFLATTGTVMWVLQPLVILGLSAVAEAVGLDPERAVVLGAIKLGSISASLVANFAAYRYVVWPLQGAPGDPDDADRVRSGPRP